MRQGTSPTSDEELRRKLQYPNEGPSRWGGYDEEIEVIDLTTSDSETDKDDDYNSEDDNDDFIDDDDEEESKESDDDEPNINDSLMEMKTDTTYSPRGRAFSE